MRITQRWLALAVVCVLLPAALLASSARFSAQIAKESIAQRAAEQAAYARLSRMYGFALQWPSGFTEGCPSWHAVAELRGSRVIGFNACGSCAMDGRFGDAQVKDLLNFPRLRTVLLGNQPITDDALVLLAKLPHIERLEVFDTHITDDGLKAVARMADLKWFSLSSTPVTDRGVSYLLSLQNLESIDLEGTRITSASIAMLARLPKLRAINSEPIIAAPYAGVEVKNSSGNPIDLEGLTVRLD
jgi:hypothetical protein